MKTIKTTYIILKTIKSQPTTIISLCHTMHPLKKVNHSHANPYTQISLSKNPKNPVLGAQNPKISLSEVKTLYNETHHHWNNKQSSLKHNISMQNHANLKCRILSHIPDELPNGKSTHYTLSFNLTNTIKTSWNHKNNSQTVKESNKAIQICTRKTLSLSKTLKTVQRAKPPKISI